MGGILGISVGLVIASGGFLVMRNPMRLSYLAPMEKGAYQRAVLDTTSRNSLRVLGVLICVFGTVILTAGSGGILQFDSLKTVSDGLLVLLWLVFIGCFASSIVWGVIATIKRKDLFEWFRIRKTGIELGPINVFPEITPTMRREARFFTIGLFTVLAITAAVSLLLRG